MLDNYLSKQVKSSTMCKEAFPTKVRTFSLLSCAGEIVKESKQGYCGRFWVAHGTFHFGEFAGRTICSCCKLTGDDKVDYIPGQRTFDIFEIKDLKYMSEIDKDKVVSIPAPATEQTAGDGFIIWYYRDTKRIDLDTLNAIPEKDVPQKACEQTPEYASTDENIDNVAHKFNELKDYDKVLTYKGKVVYVFGYTNDFIYCIKWGQSLDKIDDTNYYTPEHRCDKRWDSILGYYNCKEKERKVQYSNIYKANRYISPRSFRVD